MQCKDWSSELKLVNKFLNCTVTLETRTIKYDEQPGPHNDNYQSYILRSYGAEKKVFSFPRQVIIPAISKLGRLRAGYNSPI